MRRVVINKKRYIRIISALTCGVTVLFMTHKTNNDIASFLDI